METFSDRLKMLQKGRNTSEFARFLEVRQQTLDNYLKGKRQPPIDFVVAVCNKCGIQPDWLLGLSDDPHAQQPSPEEIGAIPLAGAKRIPVIGMAAAMHYDPSLGVIGDLWAGNDDTVICVLDNTEGRFAVRISGDSMAPTLLDGDIIAVHDVLPATGNLCLALHRTDGLLCKRWYWRNGVIRLTSDNTESGKNYEWTKEQFQKEQPFVWRWHVEGLLWRKFA